MQLSLDPHPSLDLAAFATRFDRPLGQLPSPDWLRTLLKLEADVPLRRSEEVRGAVRELLRHGGYKPTGRGKPASEYLVRAAEEGALQSINAAVDACNAVSLHSGLPISVVDLDRAQAPFRVGLGAPGTRYIFNATGQEIDCSGLLCLQDAQGPCANAVKDAQRTKTQAETVHTLTLLWGTRVHAARTQEAFHWYRQILERLGATVEPCQFAAA